MVLSDADLHGAVLSTITETYLQIHTSR